KRNHSLGRGVSEEGEEDDANEERYRVVRRNEPQPKNVSKDEIEDREERKRLDYGPCITERRSGVFELKLREDNDLQHTKAMRKRDSSRRLDVANRFGHDRFSVADCGTANSCAIAHA